MKPHKIYADFVDPVALDQFYQAMKLPCSIKGALMPDVHAGYTLPIGAVVATEDVVFPSWVGYDIGCGMCAVPTTFLKQDVVDNAQGIYDAIVKVVPTGFSHNSKDSDWYWQKYRLTMKAQEIFDKNGLKQLGTLGGGNHFIEVGYGQDDKVWVIIHSGSRGIGHSIATHYMKLASGTGKAKEGHYGFGINSKNGQDYMTDQKFCLEFALENRVQMLKKIESVMSKICKGTMVVSELINRTHNHAIEKDGVIIHRKGATHAEKGMMGVIPGNMRDGSFIVRGKGNPDSLCSSSHGAGRVKGRKAAKQAFGLEDFSDVMKGIVANVTESTLDESPFAYKDIFSVMQQQSDLVEIVDHVKPILNVKG